MSRVSVQSYSDAVTFVLGLETEDACGEPSDCERLVRLARIHRWWS
jgi:hypothetical protein